MLAQRRSLGASCSPKRTKSHLRLPGPGWVLRTAHGENPTGGTEAPGLPAPKGGSFSPSVPACSGGQGGAELPRSPCQRCRNSRRAPIYSGRRGWAVRAKPQPSATLNQAGFALTWPLSPFLLSSLPKLVKNNKKKTQAAQGSFLRLFPATAHHTQRQAGAQRLGPINPRPRQWQKKEK